MDPTSASLQALAADPDPRFVLIAKDQPEYVPIPALVYADGKILSEWAFSDEERLAVARGENLRLWIWVHPQTCAHCGEPQPRHLQPIALEITSEERA